MTDFEAVAARDEWYMGMAIKLARLAVQSDDRPFGCVIVTADQMLMWHAFGTETRSDPTRHCEVEAIKYAAHRLKRPLVDCCLYSTHEPCMMCCGAINHAKIGRVVFGSYRRDLPTLFKQREYGTACDLLADCSTPCEVVSGFRRGECAQLFKDEVIDATPAVGDTSV